MILLHIYGWGIQETSFPEPMTAIGITSHPQVLLWQLGITALWSKLHSHFQISRGYENSVSTSSE